MIPVFIGSSDRFASVEWMTPFSIRENTTAEVDIHIVRPQWFGMQETGCTGFSNVRNEIPRIAKAMGYQYAIYLDVDMLVLGDISDLYAYRRAGSWVCLSDGTTEVSVIDVDHARMESRIPAVWNAEDRAIQGMQLLHFTDLKAQPWFFDHPNVEAVALYNEYKAKYAGGLQNTAGQ